MSKTVLVLVAQGTEEIEAIAPIDILRRANVYVRVAGENEIVTLSRSVKLLPDILIDHLNSEMEFSAIVIPGGKNGTLNLANNPKVIKLLDKHIKRGGIVAAICAAPTILTTHKLYPKDLPLTAHQSVADMLTDYNFVDEKVVTAGQFVTSRGAGTAIDFSLKLVEILVNLETAERIKADIMY